MKPLNDCDAHLSWTDFNDAEDQILVTPLPEKRDSKKEVEQAIHGKIDQALFYLFPNGETHRRQFLIGDIHGNEGESLKVELEGDKIGQWYDFATGEGGDIFKLWGLAKGWDDHTRFPEIICDMKKWLGMASSDKPRPKEKKKQEDLGSPTGKWDYQDAEGKLIACVYRYDTPTGKEFRPFDVSAQQYKAPDPRPLYNHPGMVTSDHIIMVEGEKCAQALIQQGFCATTAMGGANAPLEKTDWSPLKGKHVLVWADHDVPGKEYGDKLVAWLHRQPVLSLSRVNLPDDLPEKWDAADAVAEGRNLEVFLNHHAQMVPFEGIQGDVESQTILKKIPAYKLINASQYFGDRNSFPQDLISPRILTPGGLMVFGGAPKVGKTDFLLSWMMHMAVGLSFMGMNTHKPLRVGYLQTEMEYDYMRERLQKVPFDTNYLPLMGENLWITDKADITLDQQGVETAANIVLQTMGAPDVLVIDPLRNVFDGVSENDNKAMIDFLRQRIDVLRKKVNPKCAIILIHHTRKLSPQELADNPFYALSGASALRGFYTAAMLLSKTDEQKSLRHLSFELRYGEPIPMKHVDKVNGKWCEMDVSGARTIRKDYGQKCDGERLRVHDVILQKILSEGEKGNLYSPSKFAHTFDGHDGLGAERSIARHLDTLAFKGFIRFNKNQSPIKGKSGVMCVEGMMIPSDREEIDPTTGEVFRPLIPFLPTHYKYEIGGTLLPVEDPYVWVYRVADQKGGQNNERQ